MKKIKYIIVFVVLLFTLNVNALGRNDSNLRNRNNCEKFELAKANTDGTITSVTCFQDYNTAKNKMNEEKDNSLIIFERSNGITKIIDAKYALVYLDRGDVLTYLYSSNSLKSSLTYMNNASSYGATDAALLEINYSNKAAKIRIGGVTGWVKSGEYTIIPINWVKTSSYYKISDNGIAHYYAKDIETSNYTQASRLLGPKPDNIENGNYKSYDGIYFYDDFSQMIDDYRMNQHDLAINKENAYYNYYLYLPHRSKTNYDIDDIDSYLRNVLNFKGSLYGKYLTNNNSVMYGTAEYYMYAEKLYGANALSIFSLARNESANGRSSIAYNKNNIFGHNAVDGAAYSSATGYLDVRSSIYTHGYGYINYGYARVSDSRYNGSHFGNKNTGMNVMYASDVYWGEKAANYYYSFDKDNGLLDYNYYQLIISNASGVNVRSGPSTKNNSVYSIKKTGIPFIVLEEVEGETIDGNNIWYKIQSDSNITSSGNLIASNSSTWPEYNWDGALYVHSNYFTKINDGKKNENNYHRPSEVKKDINNYQIITNASKTTYEPEVGLLNTDKDYYYTSTLLEKKGTIKKNSLVVILEKVINGDNINYLVITDYSTCQKAWISSNDVKILKKDLLKVDISEAKGTIAVLSSPDGSKVLDIYNGNFLPIVDKVLKNGKTYLKVEYKIVNELLYGYVDSSISNISYTLNYLNVAPMISASNQTVIVNEEFNPLMGVTGSDNEDGDITDKIKVESNNVDITKPGEYEVKYSLTDSFGDIVYKVIKVSVIKRTTTSALFMYNGLEHVKDNIFNFKGFIGVKGEDNVNTNKEIIFINELTNKEYSFPLSSWEDYPYEMTSVDDKVKYDYHDGWFNTDIDLSSDKLPNGDYKIYVKCMTKDKEAMTLFTNIAYMDMERRAKGNNREFMIDVDYSTVNSPLIIKVRESLISLDVPKTNDPMYNFFTSIKLENNNLSLRGTSHNVGVSLGLDDSVERKLVLENKETFKYYEFDLGSITSGDYTVTLPVSDNCDKTKAWYDNTVDLSTVENGQYTLYIKNTVNGITYFGELIDVSYTDFTKINNDNYILKRNDNIRLRLELEVKK